MEKTITSSIGKSQVSHSQGKTRGYTNYTKSKPRVSYFRVNEDSSPYNDWNKEEEDNYDEPVSDSLDKFKTVIPNYDGDVTVIPKKQERLNHEDSGSLLDGLFSGRDFISSENWVSNEIIKSRIVSSDNDFVYLDCIIDLETMSLEHRRFPKNLFSNFKSLETGTLAIINLKSKPNSFRVDVYFGEGMIDPKLFDVNNDLKDLEGRDLGTKLRGEW
ncbi:MAG: hypothetical protein CMC76_09740 [Flavobacteriaceae bacterium]|nr:hypothetical protein [Flavobacteriaceae bacterium]|tara:strand:- start:1769 stop:2416 length:648 start_codon:yes stop_codon:yes gene_type:complete